MVCGVWRPRVSGVSLRPCGDVWCAGPAGHPEHSGGIWAEFVLTDRAEFVLLEWCIGVAGPAGRLERLFLIGVRVLLHVGLFVFVFVLPAPRGIDRPVLRHVGPC